MLRTIKRPTDKVVMIDLDATLIDRNYRFTSNEKIENYIAPLQSDGWRIGLCSDTPLSVLADWQKEIGMDGPIVAEKGSLVRIDGKILVYDPRALKEFDECFSRIERLLLSAGITLWKDGNPVAKIRSGELIGSGGETVVLLNPLRECSLGVFIRKNDGTALVFPDKDEFERLLDLLKPTLDMIAMPTENDFNYKDGVIIVAPKDRSKRNGAKLLIRELNATQIGMIGDSDSDYLGDVAVHYAVGNASDSFKSKSVYIADGTYTEGVIEILKALARA